MEYLGDIVDPFLLERVPAQVDVACEILHRKNLGKDCSRDLEVGTGNGDDDTRRTRCVPYFIVL
jgi:hypothetical protein